MATVVAKEFRFEDEAREALMAGLDAVARAVKTTLGPKGRNVALGKRTTISIPQEKGGTQTVKVLQVTVTHDGVTVAKEVELRDPFQNMGAQLVKEIASKTNDIVGDGTTTAVVLAEAIVKEGERLRTGGANPVRLRRGMQRALPLVVARLKEIATPATGGTQDLTRVATIAAADEEIGRAVGEAMDRVGRDGLLTIEESRGLRRLEVEYVDGMRFDKGLITPFFITDESQAEAVLEQPYVLVTDRKISLVAELAPVLDRLLAELKRQEARRKGQGGAGTQRRKDAASGVPVSPRRRVAASGESPAPEGEQELVGEGPNSLLVVAEDVEGEALGLLVINKLRGVLQTAAVKAPGYGERRKEMLKDIAILTGATFLSADEGYNLEEAKVEHLGRARRIIVDKDNTTIVGGVGSPEAIQARVAELKSHLAEATYEYDREQIEGRIAKLSGGIATIRVGGATAAEMKERKFRVDDAIHAVQAAAAEGIVPGGGMALVLAGEALGGDAVGHLGGDERLGALMLQRALGAPARQILRNAGYDPAGILAELRRRRQGTDGRGLGFDVISGRYVDMLEVRIIDPVKVVRTALENACSIAGMILATAVLVAETPQPAA